jgi:pimeloyl-ACP methyl ester carboxylesterase
MFEQSTGSVASSHGVNVVIYDEPSLRDSREGEGASRSPLHRDENVLILYSHATGFHGRVFAPVAEYLREFEQTTFDYRGYGDTTPPTGWQLAWDGFGDDALAVARHVASHNSARSGVSPRLIGVGHSMGGAGLVMAALQEPRLFAALVLFEPIIFPPEVRSQAGRANPLADVTRRRRRSFASFDEALANFASKLPLSSLAPAALEAYVRHGFTERDGAVHIKCDPEFEAQTYEMGAMHDTWQRLGDLTVHTWVLAGAHTPNSPAAIAPRIAELLPRCTFVEWPDRGHFGPLEDPARFARFIADVAAASQT